MLEYAILYILGLQTVSAGVAFVGYVKDGDTVKAVIVSILFAIPAVFIAKIVGG